MIVVCGEALFDVFPESSQAGSADGSVELVARIGGSPFNLAVGLARLGVAPMFFGGLSRDMFGVRLADMLSSEQVDLSAAPRPDAPTALVVVSLDSAGVPAYTFYGHGSADRSVLPADLERVPADATAIHVGSYCMVVEPVAATLRTLIERQRAHSLIAYDVNVRMTIEPRAEVWRATLDWMLPRCDILKLSDEDIEHLYPGCSAREFARRALLAGVSLVVVTRGGEGVYAAVAPELALERPAVPVKVVDSVGAGDTFQAGLLSWLARRGLLTRAGLASLDADTLAQALDFAAQAAAITCSRRGADLPRLAELSSQ
jgi:fructokinase